MVSDGVLSRRSLALCGKDEDWVRQKLQEHRLDLSQVFLMAARTDGTCTLIKKQKKGRAGPFRRTLKRACSLATAGKGPFPAKRGRLRHPLLPVYQPAASSSALWI